MTRITRRLEWDAGHRVLGHEGKCKHLHGHRYVAEVTVEALQLDPLGRVVDFGIIKTLIGAWVDQNWDHNFLAHSNDPLIALWDGWVGTHVGAGPTITKLFSGHPPYAMKYGNPTAENIARELFDKCRELLPKQLHVIEVRVWETPNCTATYSEATNGPAS